VEIRGGRGVDRRLQGDVRKGRRQGGEGADAPFPQVEFQPLLTEIASLKPDVVYAFFAGGGAVKFVKDYAAAGLNKTIPLVGPGFLTDGTLEAQGEAAQGMLTTLHYADGLNNPKNNAFRAAYMKAFKVEPDVYAVQGYDAAQLLIAGANAVKGDLSKRPDLVKAMESAKLDSPRGSLSLTKAHAPIHDIYLRQGRRQGEPCSSASR
jgi:branched-chain amino acid transport system substrate-binding protein